MSSVLIPARMFETLERHLFQSKLEQGAFLFAKEDGNSLSVVDAHLFHSDAWSVQLDVYLEMKDSARAKVMAEARRGGFCVIDCHSHPDSGDDVWFSPSDISGIGAFAQYAKWKLDGRPYVATVWGERSVDAVLWSGKFSSPEKLEAVRIIRDGKDEQVIIPRNTWFKEPRAYWRKAPRKQ